MKLKAKEYTYYLCECIESQMMLDHFISVMINTKKQKPCYMVIRHRIWNKKDLLFSILHLDAFILEKSEAYEIAELLTDFGKFVDVKVKEHLPKRKWYSLMIDIKVSAGKAFRLLFNRYVNLDIDLDNPTENGIFIE